MLGYTTTIWPMGIIDGMLRMRPWNSRLLKLEMLGWGTWLVCISITILKQNATILVFIFSIVAVADVWRLQTRGHFKSHAICRPWKSVKSMDNELISGGQGRRSQIIKILSPHQCEKLGFVPRRFICLMCPNWWLGKGVDMYLSLHLKLCTGCFFSLVLS